MYEILYSPEAKTDLADIKKYISVMGMNRKTVNRNRERPAEKCRALFVSCRSVFLSCRLRFVRKNNILLCKQTNVGKKIKKFETLSRNASLMSKEMRKWRISATYIQNIFDLSN
jgi:hypothetical protein